MSSWNLFRPVFNLIYEIPDIFKYHAIICYAEQPISIEPANAILDEKHFSYIS